MRIKARKETIVLTQKEYWSIQTAVTLLKEILNESEDEDIVNLVAGITNDLYDLEDVIEIEEA